jgi:hypothetical protein
MDAVVYCVYEDGAKSNILFLDYQLIGDEGHNLLESWSLLSVVTEPLDESGQLLWNILIHSSNTELKNLSTIKAARFYELYFY